ncbi:MAG: hypothetical protein UV79_C0003G0029 [candidate division TM6 bacterium GW2011_GWF2_43_17]|nr:MAG: hypothetical protein UV79_C0003G0029 [candidate division TM6 bacterium GW2011_GWF2_43_17]HAU30428.1 hypothetical protein [Candidatus Dependentiae bacterium]
MKQAMESNSSIAWFKLAELVKRGERERALSVLRLLSHSITDKAFVALLEAELFYLLRDERAKEACTRAIGLYQKEGRFDKVFLSYGTIFHWWPNDLGLVAECATQCHGIEEESVWRTGARLVIERYSAEHAWDALQCFVVSFQEEAARYIWLKKICVSQLALRCDEHGQPPFVFEYCKEVAHFYLFDASLEESRNLTAFLTCLASSSQVLYEFLRREIEN